MYYRADVYKDAVVKNSFIANSVDVLKSKAEPYIKDDKVTQIVVSEVKDIGFFKENIINFVLKYRIIQKEYTVFFSVQFKNRRRIWI